MCVSEIAFMKNSCNHDTFKKKMLQILCESRKTNLSYVCRGQVCLLSLHRILVIHMLYSRGIESNSFEYKKLLCILMQV